MITSVIGWLLTIATEALPVISQSVAAEVSVHAVPAPVAFSPRPLSLKGLLGEVVTGGFSGFQLNAVAVVNALL
jgi:hypothetical protein